MALAEWAAGWSPPLLGKHRAANPPIEATEKSRGKKVSLLAMLMGTLPVLPDEIKKFCNPEGWFKLSDMRAGDLSVLLPMKPDSEVEAAIWLPPNWQPYLNILDSLVKEMIGIPPQGSELLVLYHHIPKTRRYGTPYNDHVWFVIRNGNSIWKNTAFYIDRESGQILACHDKQVQLLDTFQSYALEEIERQEKKVGNGSEFPDLVQWYANTHPNNPLSLIIQAYAQRSNGHNPA